MTVRSVWPLSFCARNVPLSPSTRRPRRCWQCASQGLWMRPGGHSRHIFCAVLGGQRAWTLPWLRQTARKAATAHRPCATRATWSWPAMHMQAAWWFLQPSQRPQLLQPLLKLVGVHLRRRQLQHLLNLVGVHLLNLAGINLPLQLQHLFQHLFQHLLQFL